MTRAFLKETNINWKQEKDERKKLKNSCTQLTEDMVL